MISSSKIAKLANLPISPTVDYDQKLEETIKYIEILKEIETKNVPPTYQVGSKTNNLREDEVQAERIIPAGKYQSKVSWT